MQAKKRLCEEKCHPRRTNAKRANPYGRASLVRHPRRTNAKRANPYGRASLVRHPRYATEKPRNGRPMVAPTLFERRGAHCSPASVIYKRIAALFAENRQILGRLSSPTPRVMRARRFCFAKARACSRRLGVPLFFRHGAYTAIEKFARRDCCSIFKSYLQNSFFVIKLCR